MTKPIKAVSVVKKENPVITLKHTFTHHDSLTAFVGDDEMKIKVMIVPVKGAVSVKNAPGRKKPSKTAISSYETASGMEKRRGKIEAEMTDRAFLDRWGGKNKR